MIKSIIILIVGLMTITLGFFILKKNSKNLSNISYFCLCLFGGSWAVVKSFQLNVMDVYYHDFIITKLVYIFGILAPLAYLSFSYYFPYKLKLYSKNTIYFILSIPLILIFLIISGVLKLESTHIFGGIISRDIILFDFSLFALYFFLYVFIGFMLLLKKYIKEQGVYKNQLKFLIISTFTTYMTVGVVSVIFLLFNNTKYDWLGPILLLIHFSITWYYIFYKSNKAI